MKIQIAISPNFGSFNVPKGFESSYTGTKWRIELAKYLVDNATLSERRGYYDEDKGGIQLIQKLDGTVLENTYYFKEAEPTLLPGSIGKLTVVEVDTEAGWVLSEYDGAESVEGILKYRRVDDYGRHVKLIDKVPEISRGNQNLRRRLRF